MVSRSWSATSARRGSSWPFCAPSWPISGLPATESAEAEAEVKAIEGELDQPEPDARSVADRLKTCHDDPFLGGALAAAGTGLAAPLGALAALLGALGDPIRRLLDR